MNIGLDQKTLQSVCHHLNLLLANELTLYIKTLNYHWNVKGRHFGALHLFFKNQYEELLDAADEIAERVATLGGLAAGTIIETSKHTTLKEFPQQQLSDVKMLSDLLEGHEELIRQIRKEIDATAALHDMGTNNFLCDLIEKHEKMAWMLRAHITEVK